MAEIHTVTIPKPPNWSIKLSKLLWSKLRFIWGTIILDILIGGFTTFLFSDPSLLKNVPIWQAILNPLGFLIVFIILLFLTYISYLSQFLPVSLSDKELKRRYLNRMVSDNESLEFRGYPAGLISRSVPLVDIFIPLRFLPNQPLEHYPLPIERLKEYRELQEKGRFTQEMERIRLEAEQEWQRAFGNAEKIDIPIIWQRLTKEAPVAVIQGYLGMGKSTFLSWLALYMARYSRSDQSEQNMLPHLEPALLPIFISLKDYADERDKFPEMSLTDYLEIILKDMEFDLDPQNIIKLAQFLNKSLREGLCLIMFDGLDEVLDHEKRRQVRDAIKNFIKKWTSKDTFSFNHFLITSRAAGYDQEAFQNYLHYTVAELEPGQIQQFLPRWFQVKAQQELQMVGNSAQSDLEMKQNISRRATLMMNRFSATMERFRGVHGLEKNPLLLTLLLLMQQNSELPSREVDLYEKVIVTQLESRNDAKQLPPIPEAQAYRLLSPIAFQMQQTGDFLTRRSDVMNSLIQTINAEMQIVGIAREEVENQAKLYLDRVCERGGIFVLRTGDYFGFFQLAFQYYFAAKYMFNEIKRSSDSKSAITKLLDLMRDSDKAKLWRKPFLLAVAYISSKDEIVASQIIDALLTPPQGTDFESHVRDLLLATECLIEAKPLTIDFVFEKQILEQLLQAYDKAQHDQNAPFIEQIEDVISCWLQTVSRGTSDRPLFDVLRKTISGKEMPEYQHATLVLLSKITRQLASSPPDVFSALIPSLRICACLSPASKNSDLSNHTDSVQRVVPVDKRDHPTSELEDLARTAYIGLSLVNNDEAHKTTLETLGYLNVRTESEIKFVLQLADATLDEEIQRACMSTLEKSEPQTDDAWKVLEAGKDSKVEAIRHVVESLLKKKQQKEK